MKNSLTYTASLLAGISILSLSLSPLLRAQTSTSPDQSQNTKASDSTADQHSATTGNSMNQTSTLDRTSSRDTTNSLDMNPSQAPTDSADKSATKDPSGTADQNMNAPMSPSSQGTNQTSDKEFLLKAAQGGMTEVELGKLAQEKASSSDVKDFGSHMVMDHSKANDELKAVAAKKGITVPDSLDAKHQAMVDRFNHLSGAAFDRAYVHAMVRAHEKDAAEFRQASTDAQDPDVKAFAGDTLKVIESHLSDIKSIQSKMQ